MKAKEAIEYLNKPVTVRNTPRGYNKVTDGVYILSEIQQNWRMDGGRRVCKTMFLISEPLNVRSGYWVDTDMVSEFDGEVYIDAEAALRYGAPDFKERTEIYRARTFGTDEERQTAEDKIRRIQEETLERLKAAVKKYA